MGTRKVISDWIESDPPNNENSRWSLEFVVMVEVEWEKRMGSETNKGIRNSQHGSNILRILYFFPLNYWEIPTLIPELVIFSIFNLN